MSKIRVLVVDDSVVIRRFLIGLLKTDEEHIEVIGYASDGELALSAVERLKPDLVTMDIEMPKMDGLTAVREIRKRGHSMPILMVSTLTEKGAAVTLEALEAGASDYITKPSNRLGEAKSVEDFGIVLCQKIKGLSKSQTRATFVPSKPRITGGTVAKEPRSLTLHPPKILAIGVSTGGPNALSDLFPLFPADFPLPVVIVQHMPPMFTKLLAERLNAISGLKVREGIEDAVLRPGEAWLAPGDYHMTIRNHGGDVVLGLNQQDKLHSCRPAVDPLFESVVKVYKGAVLGVILTGMGKDGLEGARLIKEAGGTVFAQDEASSVVWGMPGFVVEAGLADKVLPLDQIGPEIMSATSRRLSRAI